MHQTRERRPHKTAMCLEPVAVAAFRILPAFGLVVLLGAATATAGDIPLPRPRPSGNAQPALFELTSSHTSKADLVVMPPSMTPPQEAYASLPEATPAPAADVAEPSPCQLRLSSNLAVFRPLPPIIGPGDCGAFDVVRLEAIVLPDHAKVAVNPPATLRCTMAEAIAHWVREDVAPAVRKLEAPLSEIENYDSFECRGRNRVVGAKVSEHGLANALDVKAFKLANGAMVAPTDTKVAKDFRDEMRDRACARFMTVLGPGSDGYHESHIHVDLAERKNGYRMCQWDVREAPKDSDEVMDIPLPRPRPNPDGETSYASTRGRL
jgi:hypothetical protein